MPRKHLEQVIGKMILHSVTGYIQTLPKQERVIFKLYLDGLTPEQIAFHLGSSASLETVHAIIEKVKSKLKAAYGAQVSALQ